MKLGWRNLAGGLGVTALLLGKAALASRPTPRNLQERLAMLPCEGAPVDADVTIRWNSHQVPFIEAASDADLMTALGAVHAHLRLGQMELTRRIAFGRISEMIGPMGVEVDRALRLFDFGRALPQMLEMMSEEERGFAENFVSGINHVLLNGREKPFEFALLGMEPEPWTLADLLTYQRLTCTDLSWLIWMRLLPLRERLPPEVWEALWPRLLTGGMPAAATAHWHELDGRAVTSMLRSGSNSMAVAARRSRSGAALIASDPHLSLQLPNVWLIAGMRSPGFHCVGLMMPGLPSVLLGRNRWIAWGGTSLHAQSSDLFDASALPAGAIRERETLVRVRGGRPRRLRLRESELGPIVSDGMLLSCKQLLALRWMGHRPSNELGALLGVARARDFETFHQALQGYGVAGVNFVFAGSDGRVAHVLGAHLPRRASSLPTDLVLPAHAAVHWNHVADTASLPTRIDPQEGFVVSANERPHLSEFPIGYFFAPNDRADRLTALLDRDQPLAAEDMQLIQRDVSGAGSLPLRERLLTALPARMRNPGQQRLLDALHQWDGEYGRESAGALAFELLLAGTARCLGNRHLLPAYQTVWMTQPLLLEDLTAASDHELRRAAGRALPAAARQLRRYKRWGAVHRIRLKHMLGGLPRLGRRLHAPAFEGEGGNNTVQKSAHPLQTGQHEADFGSCARHVSDLSDLDANQFVLLGGQDGWAGSANYLDQIALWRRGEYIHVPMRESSVRAAFPHATVLRPATPRQAGQTT